MNNKKYYMSNGDRTYHLNNYRSIVDLMNSLIKSDNAFFKNIKEEVWETLDAEERHILYSLLKNKKIKESVLKQYENMQLGDRSVECFLTSLVIFRMLEPINKMLLERLNIKKIDYNGIDKDNRLIKEILSIKADADLIVKQNETVLLLEVQSVLAKTDLKIKESKYNQYLANNNYRILLTKMNGGAIKYAVLNLKDLPKYGEYSDNLYKKDNDKRKGYVINVDKINFYSVEEFLELKEDLMDIKTYKKEKVA